MIGRPIVVAQNVISDGGWDCILEAEAAFFFDRENVFPVTKTEFTRFRSSVDRLKIQSNITQAEASPLT